MKRRSVLFVVFFVLFSLSVADDDENNSSNSVEIIELSSKEAESFLALFQALLHIEYAGDKLGTIAAMVEGFSNDRDTANITLVGSQNVYNEDGTLKEIRTIELAIPKQKEKSVIDFEKGANADEKFDFDDFDKIVEVRNSIQTFSVFGLNMEFFYQDKDKHGDVYQGLYVDKDTSILKYEGLNYRNETIEVANKQIVEDALKNMKKEPFPISRLNFDKEGNFLKEGSTIVPEFLVSLESDFGEPKQNVIDIALKAVAEASLKTRSRDEVPKKIQAYLEKKIPDTVFFVTSSEPTGEYINKDFSLTMSYDLTDLNEYVTYTVYGYKPPTSDR